MANMGSIRVLCFGASITAGYHQGGLLFHPYAIRLEQRLRQQFPLRRIEIDRDALPGDTVIGGQYLSRLERRLMNGKNYDLIIVQGGGNDLCRGEVPEKIYEHLKMIWSRALETRATVLALTVTETADRRPQTRAKYDALNTLIKSRVASTFKAVDVCSVLPWNDNLQKQQELWGEDGLHLTPLGYDMLGEAIADHIWRLSNPPVHAKI